MKSLNIFAIIAALMLVGCGDTNISSESGAGVDIPDVPSVPTSTTSTTPSCSDQITATGIIWKPVSEGDGNLVVLTPGNSEQQSVMLESGAISEIGKFSRTQDALIPTYRFGRPGASYQSCSVLIVGGTRYTVPNPGQRYN